MRETGVIFKSSPVGDYGFIEATSKKIYFFHRSQIVASLIAPNSDRDSMQRLIQVGDRVEFDPNVDAKGRFFATEVKVIIQHGSGDLMRAALLKGKS